MIEIKVPDMTCGHCVSNISKAIKTLDAAAEIEISLDDHRVRVQGKASKEALLDAISEAGYSPS